VNTPAGAIGGAQWRSPPPLALRYGVNVASTWHQRAHGIFSRWLSRSLIPNQNFFSVARASAARPIRKFLFSTFSF
jgi:hypothetical protein